MTNKIYIEHFFLLFALFPFMSIYPINTDVQPLAGILAIVVIVKHILIKHTLKNEFTIIIGIAFSMLFYINIFEMDIVDIKFGKPLSLFFGVITFVSFYYSRKFFTLELFKYVIYIYFIYSLLILINPDVFLEIQSHFVRNINVANIYGPRGIATFSTEPGLFAGLLVGLLIINDYFFTLEKQSKKSYIINIFLIVFMLIATKSGTGYLYFLFYLFIKSLTIKNRTVRYTLYFLSAFIIYFIYSVNIGNEGSRGLSIAQKLLHNPMDYMILDQSIFTRIVAFTIGIKSIMYYPFGVGISDVDMHIWPIIMDSPFLMSFPKFDGGDSTYIVSAFANLTVMYGVFWWAFFYYIFFKISNAPFIAKFFAIIFLSFSLSAAFPLIWILLYLNTNQYKDNY